jgi:hypothetical protein
MTFQMPVNSELLVRGRTLHHERAVQNAALIVDAALHAYLQWDFDNKPVAQYPWSEEGWSIAAHVEMLRVVERCCMGRSADAAFEAADILVGPASRNEPGPDLVKRIERMGRTITHEAYRIYGDLRAAWPEWHKLKESTERWQMHDQWLVHGVRACQGRAHLIGGAACGALIDYTVDSTFGDETLHYQVACCMRTSRGVAAAYDLYRSGRWPEEILPSLEQGPIGIWQHWAVLYAVTTMIMAIDGVRIVDKPDEASTTLEELRKGRTMTQGDNDE